MNLSLALLRARFALWSRHVAATTRPIMIGPWTSEVGFEALYWLPFLHWWREKYKIASARLVVIGRGGSAVWYQAGGTADLFDHIGVKDVRTNTWMRAKDTGSVKQTAVAPWESHICGLVAGSLGVPKYHLLHPSMMYRMLEPWWTDQRSIKYLHTHTRYAHIPPPPLPPGLDLPPAFTAVRFYARPTFQPDEGTLGWVQKLAERLGETQPVILLHPGGHYDDHVDLVKAVPGKVFALPVLPPAENVAVLSAVLARASCFVGTYGGFAQLALRMGIPACSFWTVWGHTALAHLSLSHVLSTVSGVPFFVSQPKDADLIAGLVTRKPGGAI